jgi:multidrug efflux system outer membrane protein
MSRAPAKSKAFTALAAALLGGCTLAPAYHPATVPVPAAFKEAGDWAPAQPADAAPRGRWWAMFNDAELDADEALLETDNPTLATSAARYRQAQAALRQAGAELLPAINASADISRVRLSGGRPLGQGNPLNYAQSDLGAALNYELDLWGRVRSGAAAARANAAASAGDFAATRLLLQAQLASTYLLLRSDDEALALYDRTVASYARALALTRTRHEGGIASGIDVNRAATQLASARAQRDAIMQDRAVLEHALAVLIGKAPGALTVVPRSAAIIAPWVPAVAPSALLERRPDVAAAERRMFAANARIGVARAALFPQITLSASAGFEATAGALLAAPNSFWALGPAAALAPLFDGGRRRAALAAAHAQFDEAAAGYRSTVLTALREAEDALARTHGLATQTDHQTEAARAAEATLELALFRYRSGAADYIEVTTAQTEALNAERALVAVHAQQAQAAVDLVRALGGGPDS